MRSPRRFAIAAVVCAMMTAPAVAAQTQAPAPQPPVQSQPLQRPTQEEKIHAGDQLNIQVYGQQALSETTAVLPDGSIEYPLIGRVQVAGMTVGDAQHSIADRLRKYVRQPFVTVAIAALAQPDVLVLGDVKTPGKYNLRSDARLSDAIAAAGGVSDVNGPLPDARISDPAGDVSVVSLQRLLHDGDVSLDRPLGEGDVVYVPGPTLMNVVVTGAVDHPGEIQVAQGDRLSMAIAKAGDSNQSQADLNNIKVVRTSPDGQQHIISVDLYKALEKGDTSADIALQKGDTIYVPASKPRNNIWSNAGSGLLFILSRLIP